MGLDVSAWRKLTPIEDTDENRERMVNGELIVSVSASPHFPGRTAGLADGLYTGERFASFIFGSAYSHYGAWRNWLAKLAGYPETKVPPAIIAAMPDSIDRKLAAENDYTRGAGDRTEGPFIELICFYDNEGEIGPEVSAKLAADFDTYRDRADAAAAATATLGEWHFKTYEAFSSAFHFAADGGCVEFH